MEVALAPRQAQRELNEQHKSYGGGIFTLGTMFE